MKFLLKIIALSSLLTISTKITSMDAPEISRVSLAQLDKSQFMRFLLAHKGVLNLDEYELLYSRGATLGITADDIYEALKPASVSTTPLSSRSPNLSAYEDARQDFTPIAPAAGIQEIPNSPTERLKIMSGHAGLTLQELLEAFTPRQEAISMPGATPSMLEAFAPRPEAIAMPGALPNLLEAFAGRQEAIAMPGACPQMLEAFAPRQESTSIPDYGDKGIYSQQSPLSVAKEIIVITTLAALTVAAIKGSAHYVYHKYQQIPAEERAKMTALQLSSRVTRDIGNDAQDALKEAQRGVSGAAAWTKKTVWPKRTA